MGMKTKMKMKKKTTKKRILPIVKRGSILSILCNDVGYARTLERLAKAVNDNKAVQRQLEELRHNRAMEGHGLYPATNMDNNIERKC